MRDLLSIVGFPLLAMFAGTSLVIQVALNANLRSELASWSWAALVSYLGGTVMMLIILLIQREPRPAASPLASIPWTSWTGGFFGGVYIILSIILLPRLGAAAVVAFVLSGQMLTALVFDHYGLMGLTLHSVTPLRLAGAVLLISGVVLIRQ
jgi:transporter family-2 protein